MPSLLPTKKVRKIATQSTSMLKLFSLKFKQFSHKFIQINTEFSGTQKLLVHKFYA